MQYDQVAAGHPDSKQWQKLDLATDLMRSVDMLGIRVQALIQDQHSVLREQVLAVRSQLQVTETRDPYDYVLRCIGWVHNLTVYDGSTQPALLPNHKHPDVTPQYESRNVSGLYFAGTLAHGIDVRKAAGGFIHGFRYTARALTRILERQRGWTWESQKQFTVDATLKGVTQLTDHVMYRVQESSGPYQMYNQLVDGVLFFANCSMVYVEEMPTKYFETEFQEWPRMWWAFTYGDKGSTHENVDHQKSYSHDVFQSHQRAHNDAFLHPV